MKAKFLLCLALVLANCAFLYAEANALAATNSQDIKIVSPQDVGFAIFREQTSSLSLQIPVADGKTGEKTPDADAYISKVQAWILKTDGTTVPQIMRPSIVTIGDMGDYETHYLFYDFAKVPANELAGVVVNLNGKFYCHQIEMSGQPPTVPPDMDLFKISPTNISQTPLSVQTTNFDDYEHITVFYKTDQAAAKFLSAWEELSDGDAVISSEPITGIETTNGVTFKTGGGGVLPFKFKIIEKTHRGQTPVPGYSGYWFYLRDFVTNGLTKTKAVQISNEGDHETILVSMPGLNETIVLTSQTGLYDVELTVKSYPIPEFRPVSNLGEQYRAWLLHRPVPKVDYTQRQVWLLRADGTAISQSPPPDRVGNGNAGWNNDLLIFKFPRKPGDDAVGLAVSIGGGLYCHEIKASDGR